MASRLPAIRAKSVEKSHLIVSGTHSHFAFEVWPRDRQSEPVHSLTNESTRSKKGTPSTMPATMPATITVLLVDGKIIEHEVQAYPGLSSEPFTWEESVEKFDRLVAGRADEALCAEIKDAVRSVENIQARDLTKLLGAVKASQRGAASSGSSR